MNTFIFRLSTKKRLFLYKLFPWRYTTHLIDSKINKIKTKQELL